jgi:hypothetical protein
MTVKIQSEKMTHNTITLTNYKREITFHECANVALHVVIREASSSGPCGARWKSQSTHKVIRRARTI